MNRQRGFVRTLFALLFVLAATSGASAGAAAQVLAGFESGSTFEGLDHVIALSSTSDWASEGSRSLRIAHGPIPAGNANRLWIRTTGELNWTGAVAVQADFYVPETAPHNYRAALVVQIGDGWTWYESDHIPLVPGENRDVTFRLDTSDWRTAATNWGPGATPPLTDMRAYGFLVFTDHREPGVVYIDNVRLVRPAAAGAARSGLAAFLDRIRITGNAEVKVVSEPKTVGGGDTPTFSVGLAPAQWESEGGAALSLTTTTDMDGNTVQALFVDDLPSANEVRFDLGGADLSAYKYLYIDIRQVGGTGPKGLQFVYRPSAGGYYDTQHFPQVPADGWTRVVLTADRFVTPPDPDGNRTPLADFSDVGQLGVRTFDGDADFIIAHVYFAGDPEEPTTVTELTRSHKIQVDLSAEVAPGWSVQAGVIMSDPVIEMGLLQVKGSAGPVSLRAFQNGRGSDLGDPLNLFLGSKFHDNATTGVDVTALVGPATLRGQVLTPTRGDASKDQVSLARLDIPFGTAGEATLLAARQATGGDAATSFGAAGKTRLGPVGLTAEVVSTAGQDKGLAWMVEASPAIIPAVDLTLHAKVFGKGVRPTFNDHSQYNGYGQRYVDAKWSVTDAVQAGLYLQNWYRTDDSWNELRPKLNLDWRGPGVTVASYYDVKYLRKDGEYVLDSGRIASKLTSKLAGLVDVTGIVWFTQKPETPMLPMYLGRFSAEPLPGVVVTFEAAQVKEDAGKEPANNVYTRVVRKFESGELSVAFGKPTLNSNDDDFNNTQTAKDYIEVKLAVNF